MKNKVNFLLLCAILIIGSKTVFAQEYKISGEITGLDVSVGYITIEDPSAERGWRIDSIPFEDGKFEYAATVQEPEILRISFRSDKLMKMIGRGYIPTKAVLLHFIAYSGANVKVKGEATDFVNAYPYGDKENKILAELHAEIYPPMNESVNMYLETLLDSTLSEEQKTKLGEKMETLEKEVNDSRIAFLEKHASSIAGLWLMEDMLIRSQIEIEKVAELMETVDASKYKDLSYYKAVSQRVIGYKTTGIGMTAPKIAGTNTLTGTEFNLESLRGKYVIIDFWGTWCGACLEGVPEMKKFQKEHNDRVQIVGLAQDRNVEAVNECMKKHEMDWPNILIGKGEQDYVAKYNVQGFPTKILLDRNGKILLRSVGETEDFYTDVEKLINK